MYIYSVIDFGKAVKENRRKQGLTQQQLADACGCNVMYISNLENGKETAEIGIALRALNTLGVNLNAESRTGDSDDSKHSS